MFFHSPLGSSPSRVSKFFSTLSFFTSPPCSFQNVSLLLALHLPFVFVSKFFFPLVSSREACVPLLSFPSSSVMTAGVSPLSFLSSLFHHLPLCSVSNFFSLFITSLCARFQNFSPLWLFTSLCARFKTFLSSLSHHLPLCPFPNFFSSLALHLLLCSFPNSSLLFFLHMRFMCLFFSFLFFSHRVLCVSFLSSSLVIECCCVFLPLLSSR